MLKFQVDYTCFHGGESSAEFARKVESEEQVAQLDCWNWEPVDPKFQVEGVAPTNHTSSQKTRLNVLSYGI